MNPLIQCKPTILPLFIAGVLACFGLLPKALAVVPPPDGGYPNGNTAEGQNALFSLTTGGFNTAGGWFSLKSLTTGSFNTAIGAGTLVLNAGDENTAIGTAALLLNTANGNTAVGSRALLNNTTGGTLANIQGIDVGPNVAVGQQALESNTIASANTAVGYQALQSFTTGPVGFEQLGLCTAVGFQALANATGDGFGNSGFGYQALHNNTDGAVNTAIGLAALAANITGSNNVAMGGNALSANTTGDNNTANGTTTLVSNTTGSNNTAIGTFALSTNTTGESNTAIGHAALQLNTASFNTAIGDLALVSNTLGTSNTAVGTNALEFNTTGIANIALGDGAGNGVTTADNVICIGTVGANVGNSCYIGNIFGATSPGGIGVLVNSDGKLGTVVSSRRFKEEIQPMEQASETLFSLKPVTFRYKKEIDAAGTPQFGLVAEEVEKVNPDLVVRDKEERPYSVRYDQVNAMLLNEFLKEHKTVQEQADRISIVKANSARQEATIARLEQQIEALTEGLQKVSAQLELNKPAPQVVDNP